MLSTKTTISTYFTWEITTPSENIASQLFVDVRCPYVLLHQNVSWRLYCLILSFSIWVYRTIFCCEGKCTIFAMLSIDSHVKMRSFDVTHTTDDPSNISFNFNLLSNDTIWTCHAGALEIVWSSFHSRNLHPTIFSVILVMYIIYAAPNACIVWLVNWHINS